MLCKIYYSDVYRSIVSNRARELIKPSTNSASLRLEIEKNFFGVDFGFFVCYVTMRASLCIFGAFAWPFLRELSSLKVLLDL